MCHMEMPRLRKGSERLIHEDRAVKLGENVKLSKFISLYGCTIDNNCKISSHTFVCEDVTIPPTQS
jgi:carbonic anhydrase/acetyltransferase-like protein (isoleucine patch superfamily)